ncbi:MAG: FHA domain-containing protein [Myxococcota bacterium]
MTQRRHTAWLLPWLCLGALALLAPAAASGQADSTFQIKKVERLYLDDIVAAPGGERAIELYLRAETDIGEPVEHLRPVDLTILDNGDLIDPEDVTLTPLAEDGRGAACVLAIDNSRTMMGEPFNQARKAALSFLDRLGSFDRVAIVAFSSQVQVVAGFDAAKAEAKVLLDELEVDASALSTVLYDGVHKSIELIREREDLPRRAFVIVFSDGKDSGSLHTLEEVLAKGRGDELEARTPISTIGYARFGGDGLKTLETISDATRGESFRASSTLDLGSFFNEIWRQMMRSYIVRYRGSMDGERHTVEVTIEGRSERRSVDVPRMEGPWWPWVAACAVVLAGGVLAFLLLRGRTAGRVIFASGDLSGQSVSLSGPRVRIGGLPDNDVVIGSPAVSRYHAQIVVRGGKVEIEDLNSSNGTFVNGTPIRTAEIRAGDKIRIGDVELVYQR